MAESITSTLFNGRLRKRPASPGLMVACRGGMDIQAALGAHYFVQLHDHLQHSCQIGQQLASERRIADVTAKIAMTFEDAEQVRVKSRQAIDKLINEEWSYLDSDVAALCVDMANDAARWVQMWVGMGSLDPINMPYDYEPMISRTQDAASYYGTWHAPKRRGDRMAVDRCIDDYMEDSITRTPE